MHIYIYIYWCLSTTTDYRSDKQKAIKRHERHFGSSVRTCTKLYMILGMVPEQIKSQMAWMIEAWRRLAFISK